MQPARPPSTAIISSPVLVVVAAHGSANEPNCALASTICLTMANRSKVDRASRSNHVALAAAAGGKGSQHPLQLAPGRLRATGLLPVANGSRRTPKRSFVDNSASRRSQSFVAPQYRSSLLANENRFVTETRGMRTCD